MSKKLTATEYEETVTKGYFYDTLEQVLEDKLEEILERKLEAKQYVTKDYLQEQFVIQADEIEHRIEALIEHQMHMLHVFWEGMDERYVLRKEWSTYQ